MAARYPKTLREPIMGFRKDETYSQARTRWMRRFTEYKDAKAIDFCDGLKSDQLKHYWRAFYGVEMRWIDSVIFETARAKPAA